METQIALRLVAAVVVLVLPSSLGNRVIHRLPSTVVPTRYKINMDTRFRDDNFTFYGEEWVDFTVEESTSNLTLHSKGLHIIEDETELLALPPGMNATSEDTATIEAFNYSSMTQTADKSRDLLNFALESSLKPGGRYRLHLRYTGQLSKTLTGYYRQSYMDQQTNTTRWLASTIFEPIDARRTFPCFDEPGLRARFQINLARHENHTALSNMPLENTTPMEGRAGWVWDHFQESPPMPTYLVAFYTGLLQCEESFSDSTTPFKVWSRPEAVPHTKLAVKMGSELLRTLSTLTGVDNPLPKQDVLALPFFVTDALENWGLISFGEKYLLHQPGITSNSLQSKSAFIMAHELAHNWFGNMVGIKWWSDVWLIEGFASYYAALAVDHVRPEWDSHTIFVGKALIRVLLLDSLRASHPLTFHVAKPEELRKIFDPITYLKGYYVLRMLSHSLGEGTFLRGTTRYLESFKFRTAGQEELWDHLTTQAYEDGVLPSNTSVLELMEPWSQRAGYPVISVLRNYEDGTAAVSQKRFLREEGDVESRARSSGGGKLRPSSKYGWWVPITFTTQGRLQFNNTRPSSWLSPSDSHLSLHQLPQDQWVILNLQATGLYRVQYDDRNWLLLAAFLDSDQFQRIHVLNRVQILDDSLNLARADQLSYPVALQVLSYVLREDHVLPWKAAFDNLGYIYRMVGNTDTAPAFKSFVLQLVSGRYDKLGFQGQDGDDPQVQRLRKQLRRWACALGYPSCVSPALKLLDSWVNEPLPDDNNPISGEVRGLVYCTAAEQGEERHLEFLWARYRHAKLKGDRTALMAGLACSKNPAVLQRLLDLSVQKNSGMRKEESAAVFKAVARTTVGNEVGRVFLKQRMDDIVNFVGPNPFHVPLLVDALSSGVKQPEHLGELEELLKQQSPKPQSARLSMQQAVDKARFNTQWLKNNLQPISDWLEARSRLTTLPSAL